MKSPLSSPGDRKNPLLQREVPAGVRKTAPNPTRGLGAAPPGGNGAPGPRSVRLPSLPPPALPRAREPEPTLLREKESAPDLAPPARTPLPTMKDFDPGEIPPWPGAQPKSSAVRAPEPTFLMEKGAVDSIDASTDFYPQSAPPEERTNPSIPGLTALSAAPPNNAPDPTKEPPATHLLDSFEKATYSGMASVAEEDDSSQEDLLRQEKTVITGLDHPALSARAGNGVPLSPSFAEDAGQEAPEEGEQRAFQLPLTDPQRYDIEEEFARGGLGRILRARDKHLDRPVAVKELLTHRGTAPSRFFREALITARLEHPSIVPVHDAGRWPSGGAFYTMKLVSGKSLDEAIAERKTLEERLALLPHVIDVCDAIAYAHSKRIIHRDLKPANVLVGAFGETIVIDWGLAKDLNEDTPDDLDLAVPAPTSTAPEEKNGSFSKDGKPKSNIPAGLTMEGAIIGTPAYMPPEQVNGKQVDERADVYALGALLYHLLSGVPPYEGSSSYEILANVVLRKLVALEKRQAGIPGDLLAIVNKAMAHDPKDRYPTAKELAEDLKRFSTGQLVSAHRYSNMEMVRRFMRKNRIPLAVAAAALFVLAIAGALAIRRIIYEKNRAETERTEAQIARERSEEKSNDLALLQARTTLDHDPTMALAWLKMMTPGAAGWEEARIIASDAHGLGVARWVLGGHTHPITRAAFSPDGKFLASAGKDGALRLWEMQGSEVLSTEGRLLEGHTDEITALAFSPDGKLLASASRDNTVRLFTLATGESRAFSGRPPEENGIALEKGFLHLAFSPDGKHLAAANVDSGVYFWEVESGKEKRFSGHKSEVNRVAFSPDGKLLASAGNDNTIHLFSLKGGEARVLHGHEGAVLDLAFSPDGKLLASASEDHTIRLFTLASQSRPRILQGHEDAVTRVIFSPDGKRLASSSDDAMVRIWELPGGQSRILSGHKDAVVDIAFSSGGSSLISASQDTSVRIWDISTGNSRALTGHTHPLTQAIYSPDGKLLVSAGEDKTMRIWDLSSGFSKVRAGHEDFVTHVVFSPDGESIASSSVDGTVRFWNFASGQSRVLAVHNDEVNQVKFSPNGVYVASAGKDGFIHLINLVTGRSQTFLAGERALHQITFSPDSKKIAAIGQHKIIQIFDVDTGMSQVLRGHTRTVQHVAFSPDNLSLASASEDKTIRIWAPNTGQSRVLSGHEGWVTHLAFSPDGKLLASASSDQTVRLWDLSTGQSRVFQGHKETVLQVAFSPDGKLLASSGKDKMVYLWEVETGEARPLSGHSDWVTQIAFSPSGETLASASRDKTVGIWDVRGEGAENGKGRFLKAHEDWVTHIAFSPDSKTLASASRDQSTILWDLDTAKYRILHCHQVFLYESNLPRDPQKLKAWLNEKTTALIGEDNRLMSPLGG